MVRRRKRLVPSCSFLRNLPKHHNRDESGQLLLLRGEQSSGLQHTVMGPGGCCFMDWASAAPSPSHPSAVSHPARLCHLWSPQGHGWDCTGWLVDQFPRNIACCRVTEFILKLKLNLWISFSWTRKQRDLEKIKTFEFFSLKQMKIRKLEKM